MYVSKRSGGNRVSAPKNLPRARNCGAAQQISATSKGFLQREHNGPEHLEDWVPCW